MVKAAYCYYLIVLCVFALCIQSGKKVIFEFLCGKNCSTLVSGVQYYSTVSVKYAFSANL